MLKSCLCVLTCAALAAKFGPSVDRIRVLAKRKPWAVDVAAVVIVCGTGQLYMHAIRAPSHSQYREGTENIEKGIEKGQFSGTIGTIRGSHFPVNYMATCTATTEALYNEVPVQLVQVPCIC